MSNRLENKLLDALDRIGNSVDGEADTTVTGVARNSKKVIGFFERIWNIIYKYRFFIIGTILFLVFWNILQNKLNQQDPDGIYFRKQTFQAKKPSQYQLDKALLDKQIRDFQKDTRPYDTIMNDDFVYNLNKQQYDEYKFSNLDDIDNAKASKSTRDSNIVTFSASQSVTL